MWHLIWILTGHLAHGEIYICFWSRQTQLCSILLYSEFESFQRFTPPDCIQLIVKSLRCFGRLCVCMCPLSPAPGFPTIRWGRISPLCWRTLTANRGLVSVDSLKAAGSAYVCSGNTHTHTHTHINTHTAHKILLCFSVILILQTINTVFCILHLLSCPNELNFTTVFSTVYLSLHYLKRLNIFHKFNYVQMRDNCMWSKLCHTSQIQTYKSQPFTFHFLNQNQENVWAKDLFRHQCLYLLVQISKIWSVLPFFKLSMDQSQNCFFFLFSYPRLYFKCDEKN